jgi:hypothetical protein
MLKNVLKDDKIDKPKDKSQYGSPTLLYEDVKLTGPSTQIPWT